jgi:hypothetical protein
METWKDIPWYEELYQVSDKGRVKSFIKDKKWKILKPSMLSCWYYKVALKRKQKTIHRLVMLAFVWKSELHVNHINWDKLNNKLENLEYCTPAENILHSYNVLGNKNPFVDNNPSKGKFWKDHVTAREVNQYTLDWKLIKRWWSLVDAERSLWIFKANICKVCNWIRSSAGGYIWKYNN